MPKIRNGDMEAIGDGLAMLCNRHPSPHLAMKLRRIRRELLIARKDQEEIRQGYLDQFCEKNEGGKRKTELKMEGGLAAIGDDGQTINEVIFADRDGFVEAMTKLLDTEIEIREFVSDEDIDAESETRGFSISADELDGLGGLFVDAKQVEFRKSKTRSKRKPRTKARSKR